MSKEAKRRDGRGRPESASPKRHQIAFRVDDETYQAIEKMRQRMGVVTFSHSDTVREMAVRALKAEGLL